MDHARLYTAPTNHYHAAKRSGSNPTLHARHGDSTKVMARSSKRSRYLIRGLYNIVMKKLILATLGLLALAVTTVKGDETTYTLEMTGVT